MIDPNKIVRNILGNKIKLKQINNDDINEEKICLAYKVQVGTFPGKLVKGMYNKGWFKVRDVIHIFSKLRDIPDTYRSNKRFDSGDASFALSRLVERGVLERRPDKTHSGRYEYKVVEI